MSTPVSITVLLNAIGSDNIKIQYLASCMEGIKSAKGRNLITFGTDELTPSDAVFNTGPSGLIIWVDGELMRKRLDELKAGQGQTIEKVAKERDELLAALAAVVDGLEASTQLKALRRIHKEAKAAIDKAKGVAPAAGEAV